MPKRLEGESGMRRGRLEWAVITLAAVVLALMAGWTLGKYHSRVLLRRSVTAVPTHAIEGELEGDEEETPAVDFPLDINTATAEELTALPGIGEARAEAIVAWREAHGGFRSVTDLLQVPGIGETTLERLLDLITVGG